MSLPLEIVPACLSFDWPKFSMLTFDNAGSRDRYQTFGLLEYSLRISSQSSSIVEILRFEWGFFQESGGIEKL